MAMAMADRAQILAAIRADFPLIAGGAEQGNGRLSYLDSAATSQKPQVVIDAIGDFYRDRNANIHRGVYALSQAATEAFEDARATVARWIGAADAREIVFTRGATESINLVASGLGLSMLKRGDKVLITGMEHHANIVPWQLLQERLGIELVVADVLEDGSLDREDFLRKLSSGVALVSIVHVSNALGTVNPVRELIAAARTAGVPSLLDASQSLAHGRVDVCDLDCDWLVASGHKMYGPTGIGILYGKYARMLALPPYQGGGDMIEQVSFERSTFKDPPARFEAGTPHIAGAIGLAAAVRYLETLPLDQLHAHEQDLLEQATAELKSIPGLRIIGTAPHKESILAFTMDCAHPHDIASVLDASGVAIRAGHHCTQPLMSRFGLVGTARASFAFYNNEDDVAALVRGLERVRKLFV